MGSPSCSKNNIHVIPYVLHGEVTLILFEMACKEKKKVVTYGKNKL